jgi:diadenylate cyclase
VIESLLSIRPVDVLDILLVSLIIYWLLIFIRGTRAVQMLIGLLILMFLYAVSRKVGLVTFQWLVGIFLGNLLVVLVVVFQSEIRRALAKIGQWRLFRRNNLPPDMDVIDKVGQAAFRLAKDRTGAILLIEREIGLEEFVEHGKRLDALITPELAEAIFSAGSPIHDGAAVIRGNRIEAAGIILPIPLSSKETQGMGTRHRAAFGVASDTDAVAVVVSEETGKVTVFHNRNVRRADSPEELRDMLTPLLREKGSAVESV